jgi:hypothetical protein
MQLGKLPSEWGVPSQTALSDPFLPRSRSLSMGDPSRAPFKPWVEDRLRNPNCFDSQRIDAIPDRVSGRSGRSLQHGASSPQLAWEARRRHTPCSVPIDPTWDMDNLYLRGVEEEPYVKALSAFTTATPTRVVTDMHPDYVLHVRPLLPRPWLTSGRKTIDPEREFPRRGHIQFPHETFARDSGYALYISSLMAGEGDPGRFVEELRKEHKNRRAGVLLSWAQVEYYHLPPGLRKTLYPHPPADWAEWECPVAMAVPLPAVVTYRGSRLIRGDPLHWRIFYAEWVVNATVRFITDAHHRGLLWRLPRRILQSIPILGLPYLLEGTRYDVSGVTQLLGLVDSVNWVAYEKVGAVPIQRVGMEFRPMEVGLKTADRNTTGEEEVTITDEDEPEEVLASGSLSGPASPPRRSDQRGRTSVAIHHLQSVPAMGERSGLRSALLEDPVSIPRLGERNPEGREVTQPRPAPQYLVRTEQDRYDDPGREGALGSKMTRTSSEVQPAFFWDGDPYAPGGGYGYPGIPVTDRDFRAHARDLEVYLRQEGRYAGFRELTGNAEVVTSTIGWVICSLLDTRDAHRRQEVELRQRIVDLEAAIDLASTRERGTSQRLRTTINDLVDIEARCDPTRVVRRRFGGEIPGSDDVVGTPRKRSRTETEDVWEDVNPRRP